MKANPANNYGYNKRLRPFANSLRKDMTKAEACLWKYALRARMMKGYQFRRQRPVLSFIADFMCKELMLVIEVDGFTHEFPEVQAKDRIKDAALQQAGFRVLRFTDEDVLRNMVNVIGAIEGVIEEIERSGVHPLPPPAGNYTFLHVTETKNENRGK